MFLAGLADVVNALEQGFREVMDASKSRVGRGIEHFDDRENGRGFGGYLGEEALNATRSLRAKQARREGGIGLPKAVDHALPFRCVHAVDQTEEAIAHFAEVVTSVRGKRHAKRSLSHIAPRKEAQPAGHGLLGPTPNSRGVARGAADGI